MPESDSHISVSIRDLGKKISIPNKPNITIQIEKSTVHLLEMEDVLFHLNSAVMMPENPEGPSSKSDNPSESQLQVTGIRALGLAFEQLRTEPKQKILIAGHSDRSGEAQYNFELSELRAMNVMYLLKGGKNDWAQVCAGKHKVEDYQQIMQYYSVCLGWDCDPGKIDDDWGPNTETATKRFILQYNSTFVNKLDPVMPIDESLVDTINNDPEHKWPIELWAAVYDLYQQNLIQAVTGKKTADDQFNELRCSITYMDPGRPCVGCGESFPMSDKSRYRSQKDRRVEILFFDENETFTLTCPERKNTVHEKSECVLQNDAYFKMVPVEPGEYLTARYHLQFLYFDTIYDDYKPVPKGLPIQVFKDGATEIETLVKWADDVYKVSAVGLTDTPREKDIHFSFKTKDSWIYTKDNTTSPVIMTKSQIEAEIAPRKFEELTVKEMRHYVPVAPKWDSRNWPCELDGSQAEFSEQVMKETAANKPIVFNMNMLVLLEKEGTSQAIEDADHFDNPKPLEEGKSRVKIFTIDPSDASLSLYKTGADDTTSRIPFAKNRITEKVKNIACVFFKNGFYIPSNSHTQEENNWLEKGYCIGARAAIKEDEKKQAHWEMYHHENEHAYTGDYDLHYLHNLFVLNDNPVSYVIIYVSINFMRDSGVGPFPIPSQADVDKFINEGVYNAMRRLNGKKYLFEEDVPKDNTTIIIPFFFFDERENFKIHDNQPSGIDFNTNDNTVNRARISKLMKHPSVDKARQSAFGGKPKFLAVVTTDDQPHINWGAAYQWAFRDSTRNLDFSFFKLNHSAYDALINCFPGLPVTEYMHKYDGFTFAHELGHATSLADEYVNERNFYTRFKQYPEIDQFFEQYTMDSNSGSLMYYMGPPRMHHLWYHVHSINNQIDGGKLGLMLAGKAFKIRYDHNGGTFIYHRQIHGPNAVKRDIRIPEILDPQFEVHKTKDVLKRLYLALYSTFQDESSVNNFHALQNNYQYNGVLCVRALLNFSFTGAWTNRNKEQKMEDFKDEWHSNNSTYRLVNGKAPLEKVYIHFLVGYTVPGRPDVSDCNYTLDFHKRETETTGIVSSIPNLVTLPAAVRNRVKFDTKNMCLIYTGRMADSHYKALLLLFPSAEDKAVITDMMNRSKSTSRIVNRNGTLTVFSDIGMDELSLYLLNMENGDNALTSLGFIESWINKKTGSNYRLESI